VVREVMAGFGADEWLPCRARRRLRPSAWLVWAFCLCVCDR